VITDVLDETDTEQKRILFSTRSGISILVESSLLEKLQNAEFEKISDDKLSKLTEYGIVVQYDDDELKSIIERNKQETENQNTLFNNNSNHSKLPAWLHILRTSTFKTEYSQEFKR
jgi:succinate dehydrogenase flavin-adding protein (antitoxin of CptAB toxin-antitoxin module)